MSVKKKPTALAIKKPMNLFTDTLQTLKNNAAVLSVLGPGGALLNSAVNSLTAANNVGQAAGCSTCSTATTIAGLSGVTGFVGPIAGLATAAASAIAGPPKSSSATPAGLIDVNVDAGSIFGLAAVAGLAYFLFLRK